VTGTAYRPDGAAAPPSTAAAPHRSVSVAGLVAGRPAPASLLTEDPPVGRCAAVDGVAHPVQAQRVGGARGARRRAGDDDDEVPLLAALLLDQHLVNLQHHLVG